MIDDDLEETIIHRLGMYEDTGQTDYVPLTEAAERFVQFSQHPELRVWTGIPEIDAATRGVAPGELMIVNGFAHNGKTVLVIEILLRNQDRPVLFFTPDETRPAVLAKLAAAKLGVGAEELERRILSQDGEAISIIQQVAKDFDRLAVYDDNITLHAMDVALRNVRAVMGNDVLVIFDYADLLDEPLETNEKLKALKAWGKRNGVAFICLHQSSRTGGAGGQVVTMTSGAYGGEQQATFLVGVRRKINMLNDQIRQLEEKIENTPNPDLRVKLERKIMGLHGEIPHHKDTITVSLVKNKRPPCRLVAEIDYRLREDTGRLVPIVKDDPDQLPPVTISAPTPQGSARDLLNKRLGA